MANLVNTQTNQVENVPQDSVQQALSSGSHNLVKGQPFNVMDPDGQLISLPSEQVPEALNSGYNIPSQAHISDYAMQQKYGEGVGNEVKAFGLGALSGATFGGSNQLLKATGAVSPETMQQLPARNPISYGTGEFAGAIGSTLVAPEMSPAGMVARAGEGVADLSRPIAGNIARSLANPETSPIVAKILSKVSDVSAKSLGSAVEGAAYGLGNQIDENALGNSDWNAESIMHNVGYGALYGGALGGVLGLRGDKAFSPEVTEAATKDSIMENSALSPENPVDWSKDNYLPPMESPNLKYNPQIRAVADQYADSIGRTLDHDVSAPLDIKKGMKIADAYEEMKHDPNNPEVKQAYDALINETNAQFDAIKQTGLKLDKITPDMENPYKSSQDMIKDVSQNNHMWYYPTEQGFGPGALRKDNPMLQMTNQTINGEKVPANDVFRIVHDYFGHAQENNGFGPKGEEKAWTIHKQMYTPEAQKAMTTETRGQNSWVNYGPNGLENQARPEKTVYADQKAGILPDWVQENKLTHYSNKSEPLTIISPSAHGTGVSGAESSRDQRIPRSYFYEANTKPEDFVKNQVKHKYTVEHPGKVLDLASEEAKPIIEESKDKSKYSAGNVDNTELEKNIQKAGYNGYKNSNSSQPNSVALFKNSKVLSTDTVEAADDLREDLEKAAARQAMINPTSIQKIKEMVEAGKNLGFTTDLPARSRLLETDQILAGESKFPTHALQVQSLESPVARKFYKTFVEGTTEDGQALQSYETLQKQEGTKLADKFIQQISPDSPVIDDAVKGGQRVINAFTEQYNTEKKMLAPAFKQIDSVGATSTTHPEELIHTLNRAIPEADGLIMRTPDGYEITPYKASLPVGRETYDAMKDLVDTLNEKDVTIGAIRNVRNSMGDRIDWLAKPRPSAQISALRKGLMDYMQEQVQRALPEDEVVEGLNQTGAKAQTPSVRETFKRYAINEENRETMEKIFGGSISDKANFAKEIKPEDVLTKLFSNTISTKAAKELLGSHFDDTLANFLNQKKMQFTDEAKNGFSSNKFGTFLKSKAPELDEAMVNHPDQYEKLKAINDKMRILPDSPIGNPSGTAATTLMQKLQTLGGYLTPQGLMKIPGEALQALSTRMAASQQRSLMDQILAGKVNLASDTQLQNKQMQYGAFSKIERFANTVTNKISKEIKPLLQSASDLMHPIKGITIQKLTPEDQEKKFQKTSDHLQDITQSPEKMIDQLQAATQDLHGVAPQIAGSLNTSLSRATQYLATVIPQPGASSPLSEPYKVSPAEIYKFNRTMEAVEKPLSILKHAQQGTLTMEAVKAVQTVYPQIYSAIQTEVTNQLSKVDVKDIPYKNKLILSMLTGQDMTNSLKPSNIMSAQTTAQPPLSQQPVRQSQAGLKNLNRSQQMLTANQASAQREKT